MSIGNNVLFFFLFRVSVTIEPGGSLLIVHYQELFYSLNKPWIYTEYTKDKACKAVLINTLYKHSDYTCYSYNCMCSEIKMASLNSNVINKPV